MPLNRRRKQGQDDEILESLLPKDESVSTAAINDGGIGGSVERDGGEEEHVNVLVAFMMESWKCFLACLALLIGQPMAATLTPKQAMRLHNLKAKIGVPYNEEDPEHMFMVHVRSCNHGSQLGTFANYHSTIEDRVVYSVGKLGLRTAYESLKTLWSSAFPSDAWSGVKNSRWKDMGWQGEDPGTDFRGGGILSLTNLLYMAQNKQPLFEQLMNKTEGNRVDWEYPFAAAGVNVTVYLIDSLKLRGEQPLNTQHSKGFLKLLDVSDSAFEELYCCTFELLDKIWLEMHASYMQFPEVMRETMKRIEGALGRDPVDFCELRRNLQVD